MNETPILKPSEFIAVTNQILENGLGSILIVGEVASFKVNQNKWVFFDLKDDAGSVNCFMPVWNLRIPLEDGMKIVVRGTPKLTKFGKFSVTVTAVKPVGEGSLKKAYEILKKKLTAEGLFDPFKKRPLPENLSKIGVISSTQAAGYADFVKILNARWGGMKVMVAHTQVQGMDAPDQIIRALNYFNEHGEVEVIAIIRGGGSADDLAAFNDEKLVRTIAASKIPVITGIGHEVDESLSDLAADVRGSTPSNVAEMLSKDRKLEIRRIKTMTNGIGRDLLSRLEIIKRENAGQITRISEGLMGRYIEPTIRKIKNDVQQMLQKMQNESDKLEQALREKLRVLRALNPENVLRQGYAIMSGKISPGNVVKITTFKEEITAEIKEVYERKENTK